MCEGIPPNKHAQKLLELIGQSNEALFESLDGYQIGPGGAVKFVPATETRENAAAKMQQVRDQFLEGLAQVIEESDPNAKDRAAEIRARIGNAEQPERKAVKCWKHTEGKHKWRDTVIPGDASQYVQCEHCGYISLKSESTLHPFHL
jgi:rubrerythrin